MNPTQALLIVLLVCIVKAEATGDDSAAQPRGNIIIGNQNLIGVAKPKKEDCIFTRVVEEQREVAVQKEKPKVVQQPPAPQQPLPIGSFVHGLQSGSGIMPILAKNALPALAAAASAMAPVAQKGVQFASNLLSRVQSQNLKPHTSQVPPQFAPISHFFPPGRPDIKFRIVEKCEKPKVVEKPVEKPAEKQV